MRGQFHTRTVLAAVASILLFAGGPQADAADKDDFELDWNDGTIIVIALQDRRTFDTAVLVAPDGTETAAFLIDRERQTEYGANGGSGMGWGMGTGVAIGSGGSSGVGVGVGIGFPMGGGSYDGTETISYQTEAQIRVPDMAEYRASWQSWVLRIHLPQDELWTERTLTLPAPEPPA